MLKRLCNSFGPSGEEDEVIAIIKEELEGVNLSIREDRVGNLVVKKEGKSPSITVNASLDEAGLFITQAKEDGTFAFDTSLIMPKLLIGKQLTVGKKQLPGIIGFPPIHLQRKLNILDTPVKVSALSIDIGTTKKEKALNEVKPGEWAVFRTEFSESDGVFSGKALDNRLSVGALVELLKSGDIKNEFTAVFSRIRKTWPWGSAAAGESFGSDYNIVLDTVGADDGPVSIWTNDDRAKESLLGGGAVITLLDRSHIASLKLFSHFSNSAEENKIPYQVKQSASGASEAGQYLEGGSGNRVISLGIPCRYQNSPISIAKRSDWENLIMLLKSGIATLPKVD